MNMFNTDSRWLVAPSPHPVCSACLAKIRQHKQQIVDVNAAVAVAVHTKVFACLFMSNAAAATMHDIDPRHVRCALTQNAFQLPLLGLATT